MRGISLNGVKLCNELRDADFRKARIAESTLLSQGHKSFINCIAAASDGKYVVSGSQDGTIIKWDLRTVNVAGGPWHVEGNVRTIAIAPGNKYMLWGGNHPFVHKWDLETGRELCEPWRPWKKEEGNFVSHIYMTMDGQFAFISGFHAREILLNADTGEAAGKVPELCSGRVEKVLFTPDNRYAVGSDCSGNLYKWEILSGELVWVKKSAYTSDNFELTMDGNHIICLVGEDLYRIWDIDTGNISYEYKPCLACENKTMVLTPDGMYAVICPDYHTPVKIKITTGRLTGTLWESIPDRLVEMIITPDGKFVFGIAYNNKIYKWDTSSGGLAGQAWKMWNASVTDIAVSKSGKFFYSSAEDGLITKWEVKTGRPLWVSEKEHKGSVTCIRLTGDEKYLFSGSEDDTIIKWNTARGTPEGDAWREKSEMGAVRTPDITSDTKYVISGSDDNNFRKWEFATGKKVGSHIYCAVSNGEIGKWHTYGFFAEMFMNIKPDFSTCLDIFTDNSRLIVGCNDGTIRIWDLKTKELLRVFRRIPNSNICGCRFQGALFEYKELQSFVKASGGETE